MAGSLQANGHPSSIHHSGAGSSPSGSSHIMMNGTNNALSNTNTHPLPPSSQQQQQQQQQGSSPATSNVSTSSTLTPMSRSEAKKAKAISDAIDKALKADKERMQKERTAKLLIL
ncbi:hypothetical protein BGZ94_002826, partial [Podila epigama]